MKKTLTMALLVASSAAFSQGLIGPKLGINLNSNSTNYSNGSSLTSSSITPSAGIMFNGQIGEYFAIRPEVIWVQRSGQTLDTLFGGLSGNITGVETTQLTMNYVEIPFNLVGRYPLGPGKIELFAGVAAGYNFGGTYKTPTSSGKVVAEDKPTHQLPNDNSKYVNYLNVSLNFGLGYNWKGLIFQAGYNLGLSNMTAHPEDNENEIRKTLRDNNAMKSSTVTFGVAYLFGKKEIF